MRNGPRAAASWRRARSSVCATGPTLPPSASATATPGNLPTDPMPRSGFVVLLLFLLGLGAGDDEVLFREVGSHHLVVAHFLDRLFFLDVDRLDDLGFPLAAAGPGRGRVLASFRPSGGPPQSGNTGRVFPAAVTTSAHVDS